MGTILVVHDELNSLELPVFKKDDRSKPELRYFPISLREIMFHIEHFHQPSSLVLFSSNQLRKECEGASSQPVSLKDFGVYEKNRSGDGER